MKPQDHEKKRLAPPGVKLEKRAYIGFNRQPVVDKTRVFVNEAEVKDRYWTGIAPSRPHSGS